MWWWWRWCREVLGITAVMYTGAATHSPRLHQPRSWSWWWGFDFCCASDVCLDVLQVSWTTQGELFWISVPSQSTWFGDLQWLYHLKISMMTLIVMMVDVSRIYPAPDDNDDVTKWRGRECGQIVFYYPSMTICVRALLCNFNHNVCIIHHGSLCHYPSCQIPTKRKVKNRLPLIRTFY